MLEKQFITLPTKKIFFKLAVPNVLSMVFSSIYMMADGIFVGRFIGGNALAAVSLVMPIVTIIFALSNMIAIGSSVKVSTALGEGNTQKAKEIFTASVLTIVGIGAVFSLIGIFFARTIIFAVIEDDILADLAYRYIEYFIYGLPFIMPMFAMDNFLRACGKAKYNMAVNIFVSILNIFLDWLFIAYLGYGIEFSAISSVGSIFIGTIFSFTPFFGKKMALHFTKPKVSLREAWGIIYNGSSEFLSSISNAFMATVINIMLLNLGGSVAVASYGIVMYIDVLLVGALYGVLDSVQPVVSYNVGAKEIKRAFSFFRITCVATAVLSGVCMAVIMIFPQALASIFAKDNNAEIIKMTTSALLLFAPSYLFTWFNMSASAFLTAIDKPKESMIIMLFRTISPFVCVFALSAFMGVYGVYFTATVAGALTVIVSIVIWINAKRKLKKQCVPAVQAVELQEKATEICN